MPQPPDAQSEPPIDLAVDSAALAPIPRAALDGYRSVMQTLVVEVTERIAAHPRYDELIGDNPPVLFADNHRNHALFMEEVFESGQFGLLATTLPWVYHAYHARGVHYDYFAIELGLWRRAITAALPPEQAAPIGAVYDWMIDQHDQVIRLAEARTGSIPRVRPELTNVFEALTEALFQADDARIITLCRGLQEGGMALETLLHQLIFPSMQRVGLLWEDGRITVADEHQATAIMNRVLAALYYDQTFPELSCGRALVAASVNDFHELGAWMVATCLELDGWDVAYLGANVPIDALLRKAEALQPALVALSITMPFSLRGARATIAGLRRQLPEVRILIGGQVFEFLPSLADDMGADACLNDCVAGVRWAREQCCRGTDDALL
jgi:methanogenic corrinoid protein MtbC1